jgi:hypothetical protein
MIYIFGAFSPGVERGEFCEPFSGRSDELHIPSVPLTSIHKLKFINSHLTLLPFRFCETEREQEEEELPSSHLYCVRNTNLHRFNISPRHQRLA